MACRSTASRIGFGKCSGLSTSQCAPLGEVRPGGFSEHEEPRSSQASVPSGGRYPLGTPGPSARGHLAPRPRCDRRMAAHQGRTGCSGSRVCDAQEKRSWRTGRTSGVAPLGKEWSARAPAPRDARGTPAPQPQRTQSGTPHTKHSDVRATATTHTGAHTVEHLTRNTVTCAQCST